MDQNQNSPKPKWGMGSFFQQAVAGMESRLDNFLGEGEEAPPQNVPAKAARPRQTGSSPARSSTGSTHVAGFVDLTVSLTDVRYLTELL